jgi:hypothetical protein
MSLAAAFDHCRVFRIWASMEYTSLNFQGLMRPAHPENKNRVPAKAKTLLNLEKVWIK